MAEVQDISSRHHGEPESANVRREQFDEELFTASLEGDVEVIREAIVNRGMSPNGISRHGFTPLHAAVYKNHADAVRLLVLYGADVSVKAENGESTMHFAALGDSVQAARYLIDVGAELDERDDDGITAVWVASFYGNEEILELLLSAGANPSISEKKSGVTPLLTASEKGYLEVVKSLVAAGAELSTEKDLKGRSAVLVAAEQGNVDILKFFASISNLNAMNIQDEDSRSPIYAAACEGHREAVKVLLNAGADPNIPIKASQQTALFCAAKKNLTEIVRILTESPKTDVNQGDKLEMTPLYAASYFGFANIVQLLLNNSKIEVNKPSSDGFTSLHIAAQEGHLQVVRDLLSIGRADVEVETSTGATPLYWASYFGRIEAIRYLLRLADVNHLDHQRRGPLYAAISGKQIEAVRLLLESGANPDEASSPSGWRPAHLAALLGLDDVINAVYEFGGNLAARTTFSTPVQPDQSSVTRRQTRRRTPFQIAFGAGHVKTSRLIFSLLNRTRRRRPN